MPKDALDGATFIHYQKIPITTIEGAFKKGKQTIECIDLSGLKMYQKKTY